MTASDDTMLVYQLSDEYERARRKRSTTCEAWTKLAARLTAAGNLVRDERQAHDLHELAAEARERARRGAA